MVPAVTDSGCCPTQACLWLEPTARNDGRDRIDSKQPDGTTPNKPGDSKPRSCADHPAALPSGAGRISSVAGDFDGDHARDQLLAYAKLDAAGQPRQWHVRAVLATGHISDLALDNSPDWIGFNGLVARRAVDANGDGRDEGFVTSTGGASNDAYNLFVLSGCQLRQVRVAGAGALQILVGGSVGHADGTATPSFVRWAPTTAGSPPSRMVSPG